MGLGAEYQNRDCSLLDGDLFPDIFCFPFTPPLRLARCPLSTTMSSLESLLFGNTVDNEQSEREAAEELDLWVHTFLYTINWTWTDDKYIYLL